MLILNGLIIVAFILPMAIYIPVNSSREKRFGIGSETHMKFVIIYLNYHD